MSFLDIFLIIISSTGLVHGVFFAVHLTFFSKKRSISNLLLGLILIVMGFRIGKSVLLYFGDDLEPVFIFAGLSFLLLIGPLLQWYVKTMTTSYFSISKVNYLELVPFMLAFIMSFFISTHWFNENNKEAVALFASIIIFTYLHLAFYIFKSGQLVQKVMKIHLEAKRTKSQVALLQWLHALIIGVSIIWVSYVLNIIEDTIPYIVGPIVYSFVIYYLSYKAFKLKSSNINGAVFDTGNNEIVFQQIDELVVQEKLYRDSEISLVTLSKHIEQSTQKTSEAINQYANRNFNDFINYYRIQEAKEILLDIKFQKYTISSIAFDIGFGSLSSFNVAFKKFEGITPSSYRKRNIM